MESASHPLVYEFELSGEEQKRLTPLGPIGRRDYVSRIAIPSDHGDHICVLTDVMCHTVFERFDNRNQCTLFLTYTSHGTRWKHKTLFDQFELIIVYMNYDTHAGLTELCRINCGRIPVECWAPTPFSQSFDVDPKYFYKISGIKREITDGRFELC